MRKAVLLALFCWLCVENVTVGTASEDGWQLVTRKAGLATYSRARAGSALLEYRAVAEMDAAPIVVKRVIDDTAEYPKFMPYVVESRIISRTEDVLVGYQRLAPPLVGERDFTVRVRCETRRCVSTGGIIYSNRWETVNELGPPERKGVVRVPVTEGSWLLEPLPSGGTRATYTVFCNSGGSIPTSLLNQANKTALPRLIEAVREQSRLAKYGGP